MSDEFRDLLRKVGSGKHTSKVLSRAEAARAGELMLRQEATPAQIGAFMIAHRIKRPTGEELAGILDAYNLLGPRLAPIESEFGPIILNSPYDGRARTAPIRPLTTLILAAAGCPVISHGGDRMGTKYGIPFSQIWRELGVEWSHLELDQVQQIFEQTYIGFLYTPKLFPLAAGLVDYRNQIGKRPPLATIELIWKPYKGKALVAAGFVHPPTESTAQEALTRHKTQQFIMVKGLEGSCDLSRDRTCIMGKGPGPVDEETGQPTVERLFLRSIDYGYKHKDVPLNSDTDFIAQLTSVLAGNLNEEWTHQLMQSAVWNGGFYLWQSGICSDMESGLAQAQKLLEDGSALAKLKALQEAIQALSQVNAAL
ncbi:MAG: anthranilate phosphoribosyltransferase family protein [Cyanobacteria bacterium P01_F01_bin.150]